MLSIARLGGAVAAALVAVAIVRGPVWQSATIRMPSTALPLVDAPAILVTPLAGTPDTLTNAAVVPGTESIVGCETPAISVGRGGGALYAPDAHGRVWAVENGAPRLLTTLPGRPLGAAVAADGALIVAAAGAGLFSVDPAKPGSTRLLTAAADDGTRVMFANAVFPLANGSIVFTDSLDAPPPPPAAPGAPWRALEGAAAALFSGKAAGRVLRFDPPASTRVLATGLWFPNGVVVTDDGALIVAETHAARLVRVDPATGRAHPWGAPLPGWPDGLALSPDGARVVVAIVGAPPNPAAHADLTKRKALRAIAAALPAALVDKANPPTGLVVTLDAATGAIVAAAADAAGSVVAGVTAAVPDGRGGTLLGSLTAAGVKRVQL